MNDPRKTPKKSIRIAAVTILSLIMVIHLFTFNTNQPKSFFVENVPYYSEENYFFIKFLGDELDYVIVNSYHNGEAQSMMGINSAAIHRENFKTIMAITEPIDEEQPTTGRYVARYEGTPGIAKSILLRLLIAVMT